MDWVGILRFLAGKKRGNIYQALQNQEEQVERRRCAYLDKYYTKGDLLLGHTTNAKGKLRKIRIKTNERGHLQLVIGRSGSGKSRAISLMLLRDIEMLRGVAVIDQNVELAENNIKELVILRETTTNQRLKHKLLTKLRYYHFGHDDWVIACNPLHIENNTGIFEAVDETITIISRTFRESFSAKQGHVLRCAFSLLAVTGKTLLDLEPMLLIPSYRSKIIQQATHHPVDLTTSIQFFKWFDGMKVQAQTRYVESLIYKMQHLLSQPKLKHILCSSPSTINYKRLIQDSEVAIFNIDTNIFRSFTPLLTSFILPQFKWALRSQTTLSERKPYYCYFDEFQTAISSNEEEFIYFNEVIRKFMFHLTLACHSPSQLPDALLRSIFVNANTILTMGLKDSVSARTLAQKCYTKPPKSAYGLLPSIKQQLGRWSSSDDMANDILNLATREAILQLGNYPAIPFTIANVPDPSSDYFIDGNGNDTWKEVESELIKASGALPRHEVIKTIQHHEAYLNSLGQTPKLKKQPKGRPHHAPKQNPNIWT